MAKNRNKEFTLSDSIREDAKIAHYGERLDALCQKIGHIQCRKLFEEKVIFSLAFGGIPFHSAILLKYIGRESFVLGFCFRFSFLLLPLLFYHYEQCLNGLYR